MLTSSPSMDILVSSNLERLLYKLSDNNDEVVRDLMNKLKTDGVYEVTPEIKSRIQDDFYGGFSDEATTKATIKNLFDAKSYLCDTHTSVAISVYDEYVENTGDKTPAVIASTASPYKFSGSVLEALGVDTDTDEFGLVDKLAEASKIPVPASLAALKDKEIRFSEIIDKTEMKDFVFKSLGI